MLISAEVNAKKKVFLKEHTFFAFFELYGSSKGFGIVTCATWGGFTYSLKGMMLDKMNQAIVKCLKASSRTSWQQIGKDVHLTGQAVAARVLNMEDQGIIEGYTIRQGQVQRHFITVFMATSQFDAFEAFLNGTEQVEQAYKVTGEGCYHVVFVCEQTQELEPFLNALLPYGRYKVSSAIRTVK